MFDNIDLHLSVQCAESLVDQFVMATSKETKEEARNTTATSVVPWGIRYGGFVAVRWLTELQDRKLQVEDVQRILDRAGHAFSGENMQDGLMDT